MRAGRLRKRLAYQTATLAPDSLGQEIPTWATVGTYWAEIEELSGREAVNAKQIKAESTHRITMRYVATDHPITPGGRFLFADPVMGTRTFNVLSALNKDERRKEYWIIAQEVVIPQ